VLGIFLIAFQIDNSELGVEIRTAKILLRAGGNTYNQIRLPNDATSHKSKNSVESTREPTQLPKRIGLTAWCATIVP